jgi:hypothetical protein
VGARALEVVPAYQSCARVGGVLETVRDKSWHLKPRCHQSQSILVIEEPVLEIERAHWLLDYAQLHRIVAGVC